MSYGARQLFHQSIALSLNGSILYVLYGNISNPDSRISIFQASNGQLLHTLSLPYYAGKSMAVDNSGIIYVAASLRQNATFNSNYSQNIYKYDQQLLSSLPTNRYLLFALDTSTPTSSTAATDTPFSTPTPAKPSTSKKRSGPKIKLSVPDLDKRLLLSEIVCDTN